MNFASAVGTILASRPSIDPIICENDLVHLQEMLIKVLALIYNCHIKASCNLQDAFP